MRPLTRRGLVASSFAAGSIAASPFARALQDDTEPDSSGNPAGDAPLRVALVGCGGRGGGATIQALRADENARLVAMADAFAGNIEDKHEALKKQDIGARIDVPAERRFAGFDAYQKAIDSDVDVVILATPPGFRPHHFEYAIQQGKHVFMEKPVAIDGAGVRKVLAAAKEAKRKSLKVGVGLQRHHSAKYQETIRRIHEGAIGRPVLLRVYWNSGGVWTRPRKPEQTEMQYQMRNWYYFNWLCGDHIVEQHIHNLDIGNWVMKGFPVECQGMGGRQVRTGKEHGEIYDHHAVEYTFADGTKMQSHCRHQPGTWSSVSEHVHGSEGWSNVGAGRMELYTGESWRWRGDNKDPYQVEHDKLFAAIRSGAAHAEAEYGAKSTMTAIMGRHATYSGQPIKFDDALNSEVALRPTEWTWEGTPPVLPREDGSYPIAIPGQTRVI